MHYHYFTLEQRQALERAIRQRMMEPGMETVLERLRTPDFGVCESCGEPIGKARLQAFPRATLCVACKQREERR